MVGQMFELLGVVRTHALKARTPIGAKLDRPQYGDQRIMKRLLEWPALS